MSRNHILDVLRDRGVEVVGGGDHPKAKCPFHKDKTPSFSIDVTEGVWFCHAGCGGGSVIDLLAKFANKSPSDFMREEGIGGNSDGSAPPIRPKWRSKFEAELEAEAERQPPPEPPDPAVPRRVVCHYIYTDALGDPLFRSTRYEPKTFTQQGRVFNQWVNHMTGVERVLYRLPDVLAAQEVWIVEGEKDADSLARLGFCASCNVGGAGKWLDGYSDSLSGKDVVICGDQDDPGRKHVKLVFESLVKSAKSVRIVNVHRGKDASDFIATFALGAEAQKELARLRDSAAPHYQGIALPIFRFAELQTRYSAMACRPPNAAFNLGAWLPGLSDIRSLVPGEVVVILGATGVGKTAILTNIAMACREMPCLFFELELPAEQMFERLMALRIRRPCREIEQQYATGNIQDDETLDRMYPQLYVSTESKLTPKRIEEIINRAELKMGVRPEVVFLDYIGLVGGEAGAKRYERMSNIAEELKIIAKSTRTVVVVASQIGRGKTEEDGEVHLADGKDSGSIENSAGLVLGIWRDIQSSSRMFVKILKNTKGEPGRTIACDLDGPTFRITQAAIQPTLNEMQSTPSNRSYLD